MSFVEIAFLPFVFLAFFGNSLLSANVRLQNLFLLCMSLAFYAWWDLRLVAVMIVSICITYIGAIACERSQRKKVVVAASISALLAILGYFKYMNFFITSLNGALGSLHVHANVSTLSIILPIGISFYTFQGIAYIMDVYRRDLKPYPDFVCVALFMTFFPHLVAGPIQRPLHLLHQLNSPRHVDAGMAREAVWLLTYGYFMKVGIADVLAPNVQLAFVDTQPSGWWTLLGTYAFGIQIYSDFAGYSLIARGVALLLGIQFSWNFSFPYWSTSLTEFWRRWHISLSYWLRDYLYIPLGGSRGSKLKTTRNLMITMLLGGLWHGASWMFVIWGALHGIALTIEHLTPRSAAGSFPDRMTGWCTTMMGWCTTMLIVFVGWFVFRIASLHQGAMLLASLRNLSWFPGHTDLIVSIVATSAAIAVLESIQVLTGTRNFVLLWSPWRRACLITAMALYLIVVSQHTETQFIYFQF